MRNLVEIPRATHWRVPSDHGPAPASWHVVSAGNASVGPDGRRSWTTHGQSGRSSFARETGYQRGKIQDESMPCEMLEKRKQAVIHNRNVFDVLMETVRVCSLGQITSALFEVGGQYKRNM